MLFTGCTGSILCVGALARGAAGQEIGPPVAEYHGRAMGTFDLRNNALVPMYVVLEPFGFTQDSLGKIRYTPFDSGRVHLKLSAMSMRLPPRSVVNVGYEAAVDSLPAWFVITATFSGIKRQGVNVNLQLPHVVYVQQRDAVRASDIQVVDLSVDRRARVARFRVRNVSRGLTRCATGDMRAGRDKAELPPFPLYPGFTRWVSVDWTRATVPDAVHLSCGDTDVDYRQKPVAAVSR